jgi:hypothetical protein
MQGFESGARSSSGSDNGATLGPVSLAAVLSSGSDSDGALNGDGSSGSGSGDGGTAEALERFIWSNLSEGELRKARVAALARHARPFSYAQHEKLMTIGSMFSKNVQ